MDNGFTQNSDFDQVFMTDMELVKKIVSCADLKKDDTVLEIGTGMGNLTEIIAGRCRKVISVEIDEKLKPRLKKRFSGKKNVELVFSNALDVIGKIDFDSMVSNPPYSISEPLVKQLFRKSFRTAVLTMPWRFVERLTANPEERAYSKLSLFSQAFFRTEIILKVPQEAWSPIPGTESVVIRLTPRKASGDAESLVRELALQSDKKLKNTLRESMVKIMGKTKKSARKAMDDYGFTERLLDRKVSEMDLRDIQHILERIG